MRGFISAAMVAFAASGSVANARLAHGTPVTLTWTLAVMAGVLFLWSSTTKRGRWGALVASQLAGATLGSLLAHACFITGDAALVESAAQWVNDGVFVGALLAAVWGVRRGSTVAVVSAALVLAYSLTSSWWHVDHFVGTAVQDYVVGRTIAVVLGLLFFDLVWSGREFSS